MSFCYSLHGLTDTFQLMEFDQIRARAPRPIYVPTTPYLVAANYLNCPYNLLNLCHAEESAL